MDDEEVVTGMPDFANSGRKCSLALSENRVAFRPMDDLLTQQVLLTSTETAAVLRVNRRTVWRWGAAGLLDVVRLGPNTVRYRRASIEALLAGDGERAGDDRQVTRSTAGSRQ